MYTNAASPEPYSGHRARFLCAILWLAATYVLGDVYSAQLTSQLARPAREAPISIKTIFLMIKIHVVPPKLCAGYYNIYTANKSAQYIPFFPLSLSLLLAMNTSATTTITKQPSRYITKIGKCDAIQTLSIASRTTEFISRYT